ncbi:MAG: radical SAM protein [Spirochaetales bacterium]|jgi:MoaA/NifB/PqqE/SkfB family radical SAM enzyme
MSIKRRIASAIALHELVRVRENPRKNFPRLVSRAILLDRSRLHAPLLASIEKIASDEENNWNRMIFSALREIDPIFQKKFLTNLMLNAGFFSIVERLKVQKREGCNIPWAILMDPTEACNLRCEGCWAADYASMASMELGQLDRIIREGKALGIYLYIFSGGEPLMRKADLFSLADKHSDCVFLAFSNGTLVDEQFAEDSRRVGNLALAMSIEGFETETDMRRGKGSFRAIVAAMDLLKSRGVPFGFSTCYHHYNAEVVGSSEYVDFLVEKGCRFGWYFTYMPLGKNARLDFLASPEQREFMYRKVREFRNTKPIFLLDFWNDGEFTEGCIAGGRRYLHINAAGDVEPCAFIHYANVNIHDTTLLDALKSPIFKAYSEAQPFNGNHLRPCPLLDNPDALVRVVETSKAYSTQRPIPEAVGTLTDKCRAAAAAWAPRAETLWRERAR